MYQRENHFMKVVRQLAGCITFTYDDVPLTDRDSALMRRALVWQGALLCDLPSDYVARDQYLTFLGQARTHTCNVTTWSDTLKYCLSVCRTYAADRGTNLDIQDGVPRSWQDFKHLVRCRNQYVGLLTPIRSAITRYLMTYDSNAFRVITQWCSFTSHITLRDIDLQTKLKSEYVELEEEMAQWTYPEWTCQLNDIMREWDSPLISEEDFVPCHGNGAVAGFHGVCTPWKYLHMSCDAMLLYFLKQENVCSWHMPPCGFLEDPITCRTSELICVPKSMTKNRTISKEPPALQYYQHGVFNQVDVFLRNHSVLGSRINLHDQSPSQVLAQEGSVSGEFATIDLSAASDRVTVSLVKKLFQGTQWYRRLLCLRSRYTVIDGLRIPLAKYAPMGSSLCFVTMCLTFASCCELAVRRISGHPSRNTDYVVYGDDIVIKGRYSEELVRILTDLHFVVNTDKTFLDQGISNFREACGIECLDGVNVTPLRISRGLRVHVDASPEHKEVVSSPEDVSSWVETANAAFASAMMCLRSTILVDLEARFSDFRLLPFTSQSEVDDTEEHWTNELRPCSTRIVTYDDSCTEWHLRSRSFPPDYGQPSRHPWYGATQYFCIDPITKVDFARYRAGVDPSEEHWVEEIRLMEFWSNRTKAPPEPRQGVILAPEPRGNLRPRRLEWRHHWA